MSENTDLVVQEPKPIDAYRMSTDAASMCKSIVIASAQNIQGKKYVRVEGWQAIAIAHGCTASSGDVERVEGGIRAIGKVIRMSDGMIISQAEGFVGDDEKTWAGRPEYARRAMAQTRSISRACRSAFAHVVVMMNAGLSTTPAEEVPDEGFQGQEQKPSMQAPQEKAPEGESIISGVDKVTLTHFNKKKDNSQGTKYVIHAGEKYETFSESIAKEAKRAKEAGLMVSITYHADDYGRKIDTLVVQEPPREPGVD